MRALLLAVSVLFVSGVAIADQYVNGYYRRDGTYVQPHYRSSANNNPYDNFSTKGNVNPYTGKPGTVDPYGSNYGQQQRRRGSGN